MSDNKLIVLLAIPILACMFFTVFHGVEMNLSEPTTERHKVVSILDDGRYLMEKSNGEIYISDALQNVEPGNYIVIQGIDEGSMLMIFLCFIFVGASVVSLLVLVVLAADE